MAGSAGSSYGIDQLRATSSGTPVITVLDMGGGWLPGYLNLAAQCFGYAAPPVVQTHGDGVATSIAHASGETSLDLQTAAAVAPTAQLRLVQVTAEAGGMLDALSRALADPGGPPDVVSVSYGGCLVAENEAVPSYVATTDSVLAMTALVGVSSFVAAGDSGSTTCGKSAPGTSLSYPAVSPFVTAVGGTRLALGPANTRTSETVWNDTPYGAKAAGGGAVGRRTPRPAFQNGGHRCEHSPGCGLRAERRATTGRPAQWMVLRGGGVQPIDVLRHHGRRQRPRRGWCCTATVGYDPASGLGVPDWASLPTTLPAPG